MGKRGNSEFCHPEVAAVNKFRKAMVNEPEEITLNEEKTIAAVNRGKKGCVVINITDKTITTSLPTTLPNGTYTDAVHNRKFRVKKGMLSGITLDPMSSYVLYTVR